MSHTPPRAAAVRPSTYSEGELIHDKYRLSRRIGQGGMGVVWAAHHTVLDVEVAIKLIHKLTADPELAAKRFLQEARIAAQLAHPAICRVFDYGRTERGDPFIVSELLEGEPLRRCIEHRRPATAAEAIQMLLPIIDGLSVAHAIGIVHRDVKTENIFLARDASGRVQPKLLDFGVARVVDGKREVSLDGAEVGSPYYMSPEQARGDISDDSCTDLWSLCIVIYELVTGCTPFESSNYNAVLFRILNEEPESIVAVGMGDNELWSILAQGLHKDPAERWSSMRELGTALATWLVARGVEEDICGASLRATWIEAAPLSAPARSRPHNATPSASGEQPVFSSARRTPRPRATASASATMPGVARSAVQHRATRRRRKVVVLSLALGLAAFASWQLGTRGPPTAVSGVAEQASAHGATPSTAAPPPTVSVEDLAMETTPARLTNHSLALDAGVAHDGGARAVPVRGREATTSPSPVHARPAPRPRKVDFGF